MTSTLARRAAVPLLALALLVASAPATPSRGPTAAAAVASAAFAERGGRGLPLGRPGLPEERTQQRLAPGVTRTRVVRGFASERDRWVVQVAFNATRREAAALARRLRPDGYRPQIVRVAERAPDDPQRGPLGFAVRVGDERTQEAADALRAQVEADGYVGASTLNTGEDGSAQPGLDTTGPWVVNVLRVDPRRFTGEVDVALATDEVVDRELLSDLSARTGALAGVNGGYFVIAETDGTPGDLAGASVIDGELVSEAVARRTSLVLDRRDRADVAVVRTRLSARAGRARRLVDGRNRTPGLIRSCGGVGGDVPTQRPMHDFTCTDDSELIHFTPVFGPATPAGDGVEVLLDERHRVVARRQPRGGPIPENGSVLAGMRSGANWLRSHARLGRRIDVGARVRAGGRRLPDGAEVVNGGPRLLSRGHLDIRAFAEGFHRPAEPGFYFAFAVRRNPRTLAGVTRTGDLLLVTVEGRRPGYSVGASFQESARVLRALGAVEGVNLDGGGSTGLTVGSRLVTRPSDTTGERPIADALLLRE